MCPGNESRRPKAVDGAFAAAVAVAAVAGNLDDKPAVMSGHHHPDLPHEEFSPTPKLQASAVQTPPAMLPPFVQQEWPQPSRRRRVVMPDLTICDTPLPLREAARV